MLDVVHPAGLERADAGHDGPVGDALDFSASWIDSSSISPGVKPMVTSSVFPA